MTTGLAAKLMVYGVIIAEQLLLTIIFFRFWRASREKLFAFFALGFLVMGIHRLLLGFAVADGVDLEQQTSVFVWRLVAYLLILAGVVTKNLQRRRAD